MEQQIVVAVTVYILPIIFAITVHEAAHGYVARHLGDATAFQQGRITLNPLHHIDPIGTVLVPILTVALTAAVSGSAVPFGWAKPVPVSLANLRNPKAGMRWVALAGPAANLVMALAWAGVLKAQLDLGVGEQYFQRMAFAGVSINLLFMALNLLPILPLDGGRVLFSLLPARAAWNFAKLEPYGLTILAVLVMTAIPLMSSILVPAMQFTTNALLLVFNIGAYPYVS